MFSTRRHAILMDGGFVIKKLSAENRVFPGADEIESLAHQICQLTAAQNSELLRAYFYHARPATAEIKNPISGEIINLAETDIFRSHESLIDSLELKASFAVRLGETTTSDWRLGSKAMKNMLAAPRAVEAHDLVPNISQKGVDLRIGIDLARLALRSLVDTVIVVTGDSDLIPAFKFVRREGLRVILATLGHGVRRDLKAHADIVLDSSIRSLRATAAARA